MLEFPFECKLSKKFTMPIFFQGPLIPDSKLVNLDPDPDFSQNPDKGKLHLESNLICLYVEKCCLGLPRKFYKLWVTFLGTILT
jgi:hypothetical protein